MKNTNKIEIIARSSKRNETVEKILRNSDEKINVIVNGGIFDVITKEELAEKIAIIESNYKTDVEINGTMRSFKITKRKTMDLFSIIDNNLFVNLEANGKILKDTKNKFGFIRF